MRRSPAPRCGRVLVDVEQNRAATAGDNRLGRRTAETRRAARDDEGLLGMCMSPSVWFDASEDPFSDVHNVK